MTIRLGCAVWAHKAWIGTFYPAGTPHTALLRRYSDRADTVEGNATFYAVPSADTVAKWASETPASFRFCCKIPKAISHAGALHSTIAARDAFLTRMEPLGARQGPYFLQLPPRYSTQHLNDLTTWLASWPTTLKLSVEVRHPSWYTPRGREALENVLNRYGIGHCMMDVRPLDEPGLAGADADLDEARDHKPDVPLDPWVSGSFALVRYISHTDAHANAGYITEWAQRIVAWDARGIDTYFFMHCPNEDRSPAHLQLLRNALAALLPAGHPVWDNSPPEQQASLF